MKDSRYLQWALATWGLLLPLILNYTHAIQMGRCKLGLTKLPREILPQHYELSFNISHSNKQTFDGEVQIDVSLNVKLKEKIKSSLKKLQGSPPSDSWPIILHAARELHIDSVGFRVREGAVDKEIEMIEICRDPLKSLLKVEFASYHGSRPTKGRLRFSFTGPIQKKPEGVFDASFDSPLIATHFEPELARKAFPCFDEPDFKATFEVSMKVPSELMALSNMEEASTVPLAGDLVDFKRVFFNKTPKMSTHLLAFAVGEFRRIDKWIQGVKLTMWTPPGRAESARPQLKTAVRTYLVLQDYFQIEHPLDKIDFVAVNTTRGALRNLGLIISNSTLMADHNHLNPVDSFRVSESVAREVTRSWLVFLVPLKWWDDLSLNEGLVRWISRIVLHKCPGPDSDNQMFYRLTTLMKTLRADVFRFTPQRMKEWPRRTIEASSDAIVYDKAECVINMLADYLGAPVFREGIRKYISSNRYSKDNADDLWLALGQVSGIDVARLMRSWLHEESYPLVVVRLSGDKNSYRLSMEQTFFGRYNPPIWIIPINILIWGSGRSEPTTLKFLLSKREDSKELPPWFDPAKHWLKLNANFEGYYRVKYDDQQLLNALGEAVKSKQMPPADRLNLIDEAHMLYERGSIMRPRLQEMIRWFEDEHNDGVISVLVEVLITLSNIDNNEIDWVDSIMFRYYIQMGRVRVNPKDSYMRVRVRAQVLDYLVQETYASVIEHCYQVYKILMELGKPMPAPFSGAILASVAAIGTDAEMEHVLEQISNIECERTRVTVAKYVWNVLIRVEPKEQFERFLPRVRALVES